MTEYLMIMVPVDDDGACAALTMEGLDGHFITVVHSIHRPIVGDPEEVSDAIEEALEAEENGEEAEIFDFKPKGRPN